MVEENQHMGTRAMPWEKHHSSNLKMAEEAFLTILFFTSLTYNALV